MQKKFAKLWIAAGVISLIFPLLTACANTATPTSTTPLTVPKVSYDFRKGAQGWQAGFSDYPPGKEPLFELDSRISDLPAGIEPKGTGYYLAGNNHSDDLYMFLKRKLGPAEGLQPNTTYWLKFKIVFASNAPSGCLGIGGAPGEGVTLKAGGSALEPNSVVQTNIYRMNVDKGEQGNGGPAGEVVGDIANGRPCDQSAGNDALYVSLTKEHTGQVALKSSPNGDLWLLVGTDSGFEGKTTLYYQQIEVELLTKI